MSRAQIRAEERRLRRGDFLAVAAAVALGAAFAWIILTIQGLNHDLTAKDSEIAALARQVKGLGATPVAGPSGSPGKSGADGATGPPGPAGEKGDKGDPGQDAPSPSPGPIGPPGAVGQPGATVTGPPGANGEPGAAGATGPAGPPGPAGQDGTDGRDGVDGKDGADGKPPAGWTFTYLGVTYTCQPVDGFDPDNPRYDCQPDAPGNSGNGDGKPQAAGLDPTRRQYA